MNLQDEIKTITLNFFQQINSEIIENDSTYEIVIPKKYQSYFQTEKILITFDEKTATERGVQLIIPGSNILSLIIANCIRKGPITTKKSKTDTDNLIIRYHFFINFSGRFHLSKLEYIDVDLNTYKLANVYDLLKDDVSSLEKRIDSNSITPSYVTALGEIKRRYIEITANFLADANKEFQHDFELFVNKYDAQIRELDHLINKKEKTSDDFERIQEFRFNSVDEIKRLEQEKKHLVKTLQEKHKILFEYGLVASEIITA